jgi:hypothetical protein
MQYWELVGFCRRTQQQRIKRAYQTALDGNSRKPRATRTEMATEIATVAEIWHCTSYGSKQLAIGEATGMHQSVIRNRIRQARRLGLIPQVSNDDGRKASNGR